jgi:rhodanese-related sulfurtransferase
LPIAAFPIDPPSFLDHAKKFRRISADTFCSVYDHRPKFDRILVVDCRTEAEYDGGHIKGTDRQCPFFEEFDSLYDQEYSPMTLFIFHCEFSAIRAPSAIRKFQDQHVCPDGTPSTLHAFVLDGGFCDFWAAHPAYCDGQYISEAACLSAKFHQRMQCHRR